MRELLIHYCGGRNILKIRSGILFLFFFFSFLLNHHRGNPPVFQTKLVYNYVVEFRKNNITVQFGAFLVVLTSNAINSSNI